MLKVKKSHPSPPTSFLFPPLQLRTEGEVVDQTGRGRKPLCVGANHQTKAHHRLFVSVERVFSEHQLRVCFLMLMSVWAPCVVADGTLRDERVTASVDGLQGAELPCSPPDPPPLVPPPHYAYINSGGHHHPHSL